MNLTALNTHGSKRARAGTWLHTDDSTWNHIDFICARLQGGAGFGAEVLQSLPASLGGYRDHRPTEARMSVKFRCRSIPAPQPL
eukprot:1549986-Pyramimonas_sp.AAC.1